MLNYNKLAKLAQITLITWSTRICAKWCYFAPVYANWR